MEEAEGKDICNIKYSGSHQRHKHSLKVLGFL